MFEDLLNSILTRFLGDYIKDIEKNDLKLSVWKGDVHLKNLEIKPSALDFLDLPIEVKSGYIGDLCIKVPWKDLKKKQTRITVNDVFVLACPKSELKYDPTKEEEVIADMKRKKLKALEENDIKKQAELNEKEDKSFITNMISKIIDNFYMSIKNIHIRYEDHSSNPDHPFCMGLTLSSLEVSTPDITREVMFYLSDDEEYFRQDSIRPTPMTPTRQISPAPENSSYDNESIDTSSKRDATPVPTTPTTPTTPSGVSGYNIVNGVIHKYINITDFNVYWDSDRDAQINIDDRKQMTKEMGYALSAPQHSSTEIKEYIPEHYIIKEFSMSLSVVADTRGTELRKPTPQEAVLQAFARKGWNKDVIVNQKFAHYYIKIRKDAVRGRSQKTETKIFLDKFKVKCPKFCSSEVLKSAEEFANLCWDISNTPNPIVDAHINMDSFNIVMNDLQYRDILCFTNQLSSQTLKARYAGIRPSKSPLKRPLKWWKFIAQTVIEENEKKIKRDIWTNYVEFKSKRNKYINYYKEKLNTTNYKNSKGIKKMQEYEDFFPFEDIILFRKMAEDELKLMSLRKDKSEEDTVNKERIIENQRLQYYTTIELDANDMSVWEGGRPKDIQISINLRLLEGSITLRKKNTNLFLMQYKYFYLRAYKRKEYLECWLCLQNLGILNDSSYVNTIYENMLITDSKGEEFIVKDPVFNELYPYKEVPFIYGYVNVPLASETEPLEASINISNLSFILNMDCLIGLVHFLLPDINTIDTSIYEKKAFELLQKMRNSQNICVDTLIRDHRPIQACISLGNIDIIIPDGKEDILDISQILTVHIESVSLKSIQEEINLKKDLIVGTNIEAFIHEHLYDKYNINVKDISVLLSYYKIEKNGLNMNPTNKSPSKRTLLRDICQGRFHPALMNITDYTKNKVKKKNIFTIVNPFDISILFEQSRVPNNVNYYNMKISLSLTLMRIILSKVKYFALMKYAMVFLNTFTTSQKKGNVDLINFFLRAKKYTLGCLQSIHDIIPLNSSQSPHDHDIKYIDDHMIGIVYVTDKDLKLLQDSVGMKINVDMEGISIDICEHTCNNNEPYDNILNVLIDKLVVFYDDGTYDMNIYLQVRNVAIEDYVRSRSINKKSYMFISNDKEVFDHYDHPSRESTTNSNTPSESTSAYIESEDYNQLDNTCNFVSLVCKQMNIYSSDFNKYNSLMKIDMTLNDANIYINIPTLSKLFKFISNPNSLSKKMRSASTSYSSKQISSTSSSNLTMTSGSQHSFDVNSDNILIHYIEEDSSTKETESTPPVSQRTSRVLTSKEWDTNKMLVNIKTQNLAVYLLSRTHLALLNANITRMCAKLSMSPGNIYVSGFLHSISIYDMTKGSSMYPCVLNIHLDPATESMTVANNSNSSLEIEDVHFIQFIVNLYPSIEYPKHPGYGASVAVHIQAPEFVIRFKFVQELLNFMKSVEVMALLKELETQSDKKSSVSSSSSSCSVDTNTISNSSSMSIPVSPSSSSSLTTTQDISSFNSESVNVSPIDQLKTTLLNLIQSLQKNNIICNKTNSDNKNNQIENSFELPHLNIVLNNLIVTIPRSSTSKDNIQFEMGQFEMSNDSCLLYREVDTHQRKTSIITFDPNENTSSNLLNNSVGYELMPSQDSLNVSNSLLHSVSYLSSIQSLSEPTLQPLNTVCNTPIMPSSSSLNSDNTMGIDENHLLHIQLLGMKLISSIYNESKQSIERQLLLGSINLSTSVYLGSTLEVSITISEIVFVASEFQLCFLLNRVIENIQEKPIVYDSPDNIESSSETKNKKFNNMSSVHSKSNTNVNPSVEFEDKSDVSVSMHSESDKELKTIHEEIPSVSSMKLSQDRKSKLYVLGTKKQDISKDNNNNIYNLLNDININITQNGIGFELLLDNGGYDVNTSGTDIRKYIGKTENSLIFFCIDNFLCHVSLTNEHTDISMSLKSIELKDTRLNSKIQDNYKSPLLFGNNNMPFFSLNANITTVPAITFKEIEARIEDYNDEMVNKIQCDIFFSYLYFIPTPIFMELLLYIQRIMPQKKDDKNMSVNMNSVYDKIGQTNQSIQRDANESLLDTSILHQSVLEEIEEDQYIIEEEEANANKEKTLLSSQNQSQQENTNSTIKDTISMNNTSLDSSMENTQNNESLFDVTQFFDEEPHPALIPSITLNIHVLHPSIYIIEDVTSTQKPVLLFTFDLSLFATISPLKSVEMKLKLDTIRACYSQYDLSISPPDIVDILQPFNILFDLHVLESFKHIDCKMLSASDMNIRLSLITLTILKNSLNQYLPYLSQILGSKVNSDSDSSIRSESMIHMNKNTDSIEVSNTLLIDENNKSSIDSSGMYQDVSVSTLLTQDSKDITTLPVLKIPNIQQVLTNDKGIIKLTKFFFNMEINNISIIIVNDTLSYDIPLIQFSLDKFFVTMNLTKRDLVVIFSTCLNSDYYNQKTSVWEPFIEPYDFIVQFTQVANQKSTCSETISYSSAVRNENDIESITTINIHSPKMFNCNLSAIFINEILEAYNNIMTLSTNTEDINIDNSYYITIDNKLGMDCKYLIDDDGGISHIIEQYKNKNKSKYKEILPLLCDFFIVYDYEDQSIYKIHHYWIEYYDIPKVCIQIYDALPHSIQSVKPIYVMDSLEGLEVENSFSIPTYYTLFNFKDVHTNHTYIVCTKDSSQFIEWSKYINETLRKATTIDIKKETSEDISEISPLPGKFSQNTLSSMDIQQTENNNTLSSSFLKETNISEMNLNIQKRQEYVPESTNIRSRINKSSEKLEKDFYSVNTFEEWNTIMSNTCIITPLPSHPTLLLKALGQNYQSIKHRMISISIPNCRSFATEIDKEDSTIYSLTTQAGHHIYDVLLVNGISNGNKTLLLRSTVTVFNATRIQLFMNILLNTSDAIVSLSPYKPFDTLHVPIQATQTGILKIGVSATRSMNFPLSYIYKQNYPRFLNIGDDVNPYYVRIAVQITYKKTKTNEIKTLYKVLIYPMLVLNNYMPESLEYRILQKNDKEERVADVGIIKPGHPYCCTKYNWIGDKYRIAFRPQGSRFIWPHFEKCVSLSTNANSYFTLESANHTPLYLHYIFKQDIYNTIICNIYIDYWIINKTGINLRVSQKPEKQTFMHSIPSFPVHILSKDDLEKQKKNKSKVDKESLSEFVKPYIFSHTKTKAKQQFIYVSTINSKWSSKVNIKALGITSQCVLFPTNPNDTEYILSVTISHAPSVYSQSYVVTITHQYMLYNKLSTPIQLQQCETTNSVSLLPSQVIPLSWSKSNACHMFKILLQNNVYDWSPEISIDRQLEVDVEMNKVLKQLQNTKSSTTNDVIEYTSLLSLNQSEDKKYIHINSTKLSQFNCITFRDIPESNLTYCISNCCTLDCIIVSQVGSSFNKALRLNPFSSHMWVPPLPFEDLFMDVYINRIDDVNNVNQYQPMTRIHLGTIGEITTLHLESPSRTIYISLEMEGTSKVLLFCDIRPITTGMGSGGQTTSLEMENLMRQQYDSRINILRDYRNTYTLLYKEYGEKYDYLLNHSTSGSGRTSSLSTLSHNSFKSNFIYTPNTNMNTSTVPSMDMNITIPPQLSASMMESSNNSISEGESLYIYLEQIVDIPKSSTSLYSYIEISDGNNLYTTQHLSPISHYINDNVVFHYDPKMVLYFNLYTDYKAYTNTSYLELDISQYQETNHLYNLLLPLKNDINGSISGYLYIQIMHTTIPSLLKLSHDKQVIHDTIETIEETLYKVCFECTIGTIYMSKNLQSQQKTNDYNRITSIHKQRALNVGIFELYKEIDKTVKESSFTPVSPFQLDNGESAAEYVDEKNDYTSIEKKMNFNVILHEAYHIGIEDRPLKNVYAVLKLKDVLYHSEFSHDKEKETILNPTTPREISFYDYNIGLTFSKTSNDYMIVTEVYKDSEAAVKNVLPGMILVSINDLHQGYTSSDIRDILNTNKRPIKMTFMYITMNSLSQYYKVFFEEVITFPVGLTCDVDEYTISLYEANEDNESISRRSSVDTINSTNSLSTSISGAGKDHLLFRGTFPIHRYNNWSSTVTTITSPTQLNMETYWSNDTYRKQILDTKINIHLEGFGLSLIDQTPKELLYCHLNDFNMKFLTYESNKEVFEIKIDNVQVDNQLALTSNEVIFGCENKRKNPFLHLSTMFTIQPNILFFNYFGSSISSLFVSLDSHILVELMDFVMNLKLNLLKDMNDEGLTCLQKSQDFQSSILIPSMNTTSMRIFAEIFQIHPFSVSVTNHIDPAYSLTSKIFSSMPGMMPIETFFSTLQSVLGNLDHVKLPFKSYITEDIFLYQDTLVNQLVNHYKYEGIKNAYKFIGGINLLGNPIGLFENIGTGIKAFFYEPIQDAVQGNEELNKGLAKGGKVFLQTTTYGIINSARAFTGVIGDTLTSLTFDQEYKIDRASGKKGFVYGITSGFTGLYKEPINGANKNGFVGALEGVGKGLIGVVTKPIVGVFDGASNAFDSIKDSTKLYSKVKRSRLPRYISYDNKIDLYDSYHAYGQYILILSQSIKKTVDIQDDKYLFHCIVDNDTHVLLMTRYHILLLTDKFDTLWCLPLRSVSVINNGEELRLMYINDQYTLVVANEELADRLTGFLKSYNMWTDSELLPYIDTIIDYMKKLKDKKPVSYQTLPSIDTLSILSVQLIRTQTRYENKSNSLIKMNSNAFTEYVLEVVSTSPSIVWTISRRYKEFQHYYQQLQKVLPKEIFASIRFPVKKMNIFGKHINHEVENERQELFGIFIQNFVNKPEILALPCTNDFLKKNPVNMHSQK